MYFYDNSDAINCVGWFLVHDRYGVNTGGPYFVFSDSIGNGWSDSEDIDHTIDYGSYSYSVAWLPILTGPTDMKLHGFRIYYYPAGARHGSSMKLADPQ